MTARYDDIMHLPHPNSSKHPRMAALGRAAQFAPFAALGRAAQFAPFAALTGYEGTIRETARLTDAKAELDEEKIAALDMKLRFLADHLSECPQVSVTYFKPDSRKQGGAYQVITGMVKKIDAFEKTVLMAEGTLIPIANIFEISGSLCSSIDQE